MAKRPKSQSAAEKAPTPAKGKVQALSNRRYPLATTREGKRVAGVYLAPEALRQLKQLALDEDTTIQDLLIEGVNAVFEARGKSRIA